MLHALRVTTNGPQDTYKYCGVGLDLALHYGYAQKVVVRKVRGANGGLVGFDLDRHDPQWSSWTCRLCREPQ